ncbi:MAG: DUF3330 domain-containing protein [Pseudomonadota bacterium]
MSQKPETTDVPIVSCQVCLKEIPKSVAKSLEGPEYVYYFCGADCYYRWQQQTNAEPWNKPKG